MGFGLAVSLRLEKVLADRQGLLVQFSIGEFLMNFLISSLMIVSVFILAKKFKRIKKSFFKGLFLLATVLGSLISLSVFIGNFAFLVIAFLVWFWWKKPSVFSHNLLMILGLVGAGSLLGLRLTPQTVIILLVIFSAYDYLAVYKTKHMVKMAREMVSQGAILGLILPQTMTDFSSPLTEVRPAEGRFFVLGGGDMAFPLMFVASLAPDNILAAMIVAGFAILGLLANFWVLAKQRERQFLPALPLIALFSILGFFLSKLIC